MNKSKYTLIGFLLGVTLLVAVGAKITSNTLSLGDGADTDKTFEARNGDANPPNIHYDAATNAWQFSNDGTLDVDIGSGSGGGGGTVGTVNSLENPSCETDTDDWTETGSGTLAHTTTASLVGFGSGSCSMDFSATGETMESNDFTIDQALEEKNCLAIINYSSALVATGDIKLQVKNTANAVLATVDLEATVAGEWAKVSLGFLCEASDTYQLSLESTTNAAILYFDEMHIGSDVREIEVSQASFYGSFEYDWTTGCTFSQGSDTWASMGADASCTSSTATGKVTAPDTLIPAFKMVDAPAGNYFVKVITTLGVDVAQVNCGFRLSDGTTFGAEQHVEGDGTGAFVSSGSISHTFTYSDSGTRSIEIQSTEVTTNGNCEIDLSIAGLVSEGGVGLRFEVYRYPTASEVGLVVDSEPKTKILHAEHYLLANAACQWAKDTGGAWSAFSVLDANCLFRTITNVNGGTVTSKGGSSELPGVVWTPDSAGYYEVCAYPTVGHTAGQPSAFRLINTTTSQVIASASSYASTVTVTTPIILCGYVNISSVSAQAIEIQALENSSGSAIVNSTAAGATALDQTIINWTFIPVSTPGPVITYPKQAVSIFAWHYTAGAQTITWTWVGTAQIGRGAGDADVSFETKKNVSGGSIVSLEVGGNPIQGIVWTPALTGTYEICSNLNGVQRTGGTAQSAFVLALNPVDETDVQDSEVIAGLSLNGAGPDTLSLCGIIEITSASDQTIFWASGDNNVAGHSTHNVTSVGTRKTGLINWTIKRL